MATTKKSQLSSQAIQKRRKALKPPHRQDSIPQVSDANGPRPSKNAMTNGVTPRLEHAKDRGSSGTSIGGSLAERNRVSNLTQTYTETLGVVSYFAAALGILDPKTLQANLGLQEKEFFAALSDSHAEFVHQMQPRDLLEKLALEQLMLHHARVLRLSQQACCQSDPEPAKLLHEACDGASGSFRRLMTAINENRRPRQKAAIAIDQANVANQQVVQNVTPDPGKKRQTNKDSDE